jgi:hypothetical protein
MNAVTFKHMFTGKTVTILDKKDCKAIIHGMATNKENPAGVECTFILIEGVSTAVPVQETESEIMAKLGLTQEKTHE